MRTVRIALLALAAAAAAAPARGEDEKAPPKDLRARVDAYLTGLADAGLFSGTVLIARDGKVVVEAAYGKADVAAGVANQPATQFKLMSVSKAITAVAVMRLVQDGKLGLDDPVADLLPSWPKAWRGVTVHHLLDHTSGIANIAEEWAQAAFTGGADRGLAAWKAFAPRLADRPLADPAGTRSSYSNFNYVLLGCVVEAASRKTYAEYLRAAVLGPAEMKRTGFDDGTRRDGLSIGYFRGKDGAPEASFQDMSGILAAGGIFSTVGDLWRLDRALRGETILSAATKKRMETPTSVSPYYACGWQLMPVRGRRCVHHSGGANGYVADLLRFPDDDACVAVQSNFAFAPIMRISDDLAGLLFGAEIPTAKRMAADTLDACAGLYRTPGRTLLIRRSGEGLLCFDVDPRTERLGGRLLLPVADDLCLMPYGDERLRFAKPQDGRCARVTSERTGGAMPLDRAPSLGDAWRSVVGDWPRETAGAAALRITEASGRINLNAPDAWPFDFEVVPVSETLAIAFYGPEGGTLVHLTRDADGRPTALRWQSNDGRTIACARQAK